MEVIYEDNHLIAVNKNCHELVQGDKTGDASLVDMLKSWLKRKDTKNILGDCQKPSVRSGQRTYTLAYTQ